MYDVQTCRTEIQDGMTLERLTESVRTLPERLPVMIGEVLRGHEHDIMELQRIQLLEGKDSDGKDIHPFYTEDLKPQGYFHSAQSAARYAAWKEDLSYPFSVSRNHNAPNLYITGKFHEELGCVFGTQAMQIAPMTGYAAAIVAKYGRNTFGLSWEKWDTLFNERGVKDEIVETFKRRLYD